MRAVDPFRVVLERILPAPPADVFRAWTDPESLRAFMCPLDIVSVVVDADVRVGGRFRIVMRDGTADLEHTGEYRLVDPPHRLVFTWHSPITGPDGSLVSIALSPHEDGTRLVLTHEQLPSDDVAGKHARGWTSILEKLARHVAPAPRPDVAPADLRMTFQYPVRCDTLHAQLATAAGIRHWWTEHCEMDPVVGGRAAFRFPDAGFYAIVRITALDPPRRVEWHVVASQHPESSRYVDLHDWVGTRIAFDLEAVDATHSRLRFTHHGLAPLECSTACTSAWSFFLGQSLREYLETGTGRPTKAGPDASASDFTRRVHVDAPPGAVYAALTTPGGLRSWWTTDCDVARHVGGRSTFRFGPSRNVMEILALAPEREVRWRCVQQHHDAPGGLERTNEWEGTTLVFRLSPASGGGTDLVFEHQGLVPALECYAICENRWRHHLDASLPRYLETGAGLPFAAAHD